MKGSTLSTVIPVPKLVWILIVVWPTTAQVLSFAKTLPAYSSVLLSKPTYKKVLVQSVIFPGQTCWPSQHKGSFTGFK